MPKTTIKERVWEGRGLRFNKILRRKINLVGGQFWKQVHWVHIKADDVTLEGKCFLPVAGGQIS